MPVALLPGVSRGFVSQISRNDQSWSDKMGLRVDHGGVKGLCYIIPLSGSLCFGTAVLPSMIFVEFSMAGKYNRPILRITEC